MCHTGQPSQEARKFTRASLSLGYTCAKLSASSPVQYLTLHGPVKHAPDVGACNDCCVVARRQFTQVGWTRHAVTDCHPARGCDTCLVCSSAVLAFYRCSGWLCLPACVALSDCLPLFAVWCQTVCPCLQCGVRLSVPVCSALSDCRSLPCPPWGGTSPLCSCCARQVCVQVRVLSLLRLLARSRNCTL